MGINRHFSGKFCEGGQHNPDIQLDSWHIASLPLFRAVFPDTPILFLYREPDKVLSSHRRQRDKQIVPGQVEAAMPPLDFAPSAPSAPGDLDGYCANMLEYFSVAPATMRMS